MREDALDFIRRRAVPSPERRDVRGDAIAGDLDVTGLKRMFNDCDPRDDEAPQVGSKEAGVLAGFFLGESAKQKRAINTTLDKEAAESYRVALHKWSERLKGGRKGGTE